LSLSTVATQNESVNRFVAAAGTTANCVVGALCLLALRRIRKLTPWTYFLWIFAAFNLWNIGSLFMSVVLDSGDWALVIFGLYPPWIWQYFLGLAGVALYVLAVHGMSGFLIDGMNRGEIALADLNSLVWPAYLAAGAVMTIASIFNPFSPRLILFYGAGASFGLNVGLLFLPRMAAASARSPALVTRPLLFSYVWLTLALVVSGIFIAVLGPGIEFSN
jgi:hypothetical protein